jgi:hypothetical protein
MYKICILYNVQTSVTFYYNHIFKVVNMIMQRSVKNMLSLLTQRERSIILWSSGMDLLGGIGGGGSVSEVH